MKRRIYLTLERGRDIALRNLLRKVFVAGGFEERKDPSVPAIRRTRVPVAEFAAAISLGSKESVENDEVECLLANMIYKVRLQVPIKPRLTLHVTEPHEGVHCERPWDCGVEQRWGFSRHGYLNLKQRKKLDYAGWRHVCHKRWLLDSPISGLFSHTLSFKIIMVSAGDNETSTNAKHSETCLSQRIPHPAGSGRQVRGYMTHNSLRGLRH